MIENIKFKNNFIIDNIKQNNNNNYVIFGANYILINLQLQVIKHFLTMAISIIFKLFLFILL